MPDVENQLREELKRAAEQVQPELLRPLQVPTRRLSWRPRLLPLAAAAAVIAVVTAGALVAGLTAAHQPAAHQPAAHQPAAVGPAPASLPRFYVTTSSPPTAAGYRR
jgi:negative regulator of sigma E activity